MIPLNLFSFCKFCIAYSNIYFFILSSCYICFPEWVCLQRYSDTEAHALSFGWSPGLVWPGRALASPICFLRLLYGSFYHCDPRTHDIFLIFQMSFNCFRQMKFTVHNIVSLIASPTIETRPHPHPHRRRRKGRARR